MAVLDGRVVIVGERSTSLGAIPLSGDAGRRFARLGGVELGEFLQLRRVNLWFHDEEPRGRGRADAMASRLDGKTAILLGRKVATAFGVGDLPPLSFVPVRYGSGEGFWLALVPHPSGRNRWYNDSERRSRAEAFVRELLRTARPPTGWPLVETRTYQGEENNA